MKEHSVKPRTVIIIGAFMFFAGVPWTFMGMNYVHSWYDVTQTQGISLPTQPDQRFYFDILGAFYNIFFFGGIGGMTVGIVFLVSQSRKQKKSPTTPSAN